MTEDELDRRVRRLGADLAFRHPGWVLRCRCRSLLRRLVGPGDVWELLGTMGTSFGAPWAPMPRRGPKGRLP